MSRLFKTIHFLAAIAFLVAACSTQFSQGETVSQNKNETITYQSVLGKPLNDQVVVDFMSRYYCSSAARFQLCESAGVALLIDSNQVVETVYLYLNNDEGFLPYKGDLPLGLKSADNMGTVVNKLKRQGVGNAGLPDQGTSPDHVHYWATYKQVNMTIIYNSPGTDQSANIFAVLVNR